MRVLLTTVLWVCFSFSLHAQSNVATYNLKERFGVNHEQQVICLTDTAAPQNPNTSRVLAPNGVDVVQYQQIQVASGNKLCVQSAVPRTDVPAVFTLGNGGVDTTTDSLIFNNDGVAPDLLLAVGDLVYFQSGGGTVNCGLVDGTSYYIAGRPDFLRYSFKATLGGSVIDFPLGCGSGNAITITKTGFTAVASSDIITEPHHHRSDREPVYFTGTVPAGLTVCTVSAQCYVKYIDADTYQVSTTVGGSAVNITADLTSGINQTNTDWTFTLQNGTTPGGTVTNPVITDFSNSSYFTLDNGLTAFRVGKFTNPTIFRTGGGGLTGCGLDGSNHVVCTLTGSGGNSFVNGGRFCATGPNYFDRNGCYTVASHTSTTVTSTETNLGSGYVPNVDIITNGDLSYNPLQGFRLPTGEWLGTTNARLYASSQGWPGGVELDSGPQSLIEKLTPQNLSYSTSFIAYGPLVTIIKATFTTDRPVYVNGAGVAVGGTNTRGTGEYTMIFTAIAGRKSFLDQIATDMNYAWNSEMYTAWPAAKPDTLNRRIGGGVTYANPQCGYFYPSDSHSDNFFDGYATEDLTYTTNIELGSGCTPGSVRAKMGIWQNADTGKGHQMVISNLAASSSAPVVGLYAGRASLGTIGLLNKACPSALCDILVGVTSSNNFFASGTTSLAITMVTQPGFNGALNSREIGIFTGTKADINAESDVYGYNNNLIHEQNLMAGVSANKLAQIDFAFADPVGGWKHAFMPDASVATACANYQNNTPTSPVVSNWTAMVGRSTAETTAGILAVCAGNNTAAVETALSSFYLSAANYMATLIYSDGIYAQPFAGTEVVTTRALSILQFILAFSATSADQTLRAKAYASLIGALAVDQDVYPILASCLDSCGTTNQGQQMASSFNLAGTIFATQPQIAPYVPTVATNTTGQINYNFNAYGACFSSTQYCGTLAPVFAVALAQKKLNGISPIRYPRLQKFSEFFANMMTPPEPRFGGNSSNGQARMFNSWGTSSLKDSDFMGLSATLWDGVDTTLSQNSLQAWFPSRSTAGSGYLPLEDYFFCDFCAIDTTITQTARTLTTKNWPGYFIALRNNFGTANESAVFLGTPSFLTDHWHWHDYGQIDAYLLGVPFLVDPAANEYFPDTNGCRWGSVVCLDSRNTSGAWNADLTSVTDSPQYYGTITQCDVLNFTKVSLGCAQMVGADTWTRNVILTNGNATLPILAVLDKFTVNGTATPSLIDRTDSFLPLGTTVVTPAGNITPTARVVECINPTPSTFPSGGASNALGAGLQSFSIVGPPWIALGAGGNGIDTDILVLRGTSNDHYAVGAFTLSCTAARQMNEWVTANGGSYSETHDRLLFNGQGDFSTWIAAHFKNVTPTRTPTTGSGCLVMNTTSPVVSIENVCPTYYSYTDGSTIFVLGVFDTTTRTGLDNIVLSGGSQEAVMAVTSGVWTITGMTAGTRCIDLSGKGGTWHADAAVTNPTANKFCRYHPGSDPITGQPAVYTVNLSTTPNSAVPALVSFGKPSGATTIRVQINGQYVSSASCGSTACEATVLAAPGFTEAHDYQ